MEPIPETIEAIGELDPADDDGDLLAQLLTRSADVRALVPECIGFSLTMRNHDVTLTLVATDAEISALDAVQYLAGGPCVAAVHTDHVLAMDHEAMDEAGWQLFSAATAARGVASTLSMPVLDRGVVVGGVNLYGRTATAFEGHHDALADVLDAWAEGAITNADLAFTTLDAARRAPQQLRAEQMIEVASGLLAAHLRIEVDTARANLLVSAAQAQCDPLTLATQLVETLTRRTSGPGA